MQKIFFSGIGGAGVSALASFMADKGAKVSGSDRSFDTDRSASGSTNKPSHPAYQPLVKKGVAIEPQDGTGIKPGLDLVVFSTAVEKDLPEPKRCAELNLKTMTRPEFLAQLVAEHRTFAVAGTSGKSTTSGMLAFMMKELGLEPNFIGGGRVSQFKSADNLGNSITGESQLLVVEACESDGSIVGYKPEITLLLNLDLDHHSVEKTAEMFQILARNTSKKTIFNADDAHLPGLKLHNSCTFGVDQPAKYKAENLKLNVLSSEFTLNGTKFTVSLPGRYNVYNAVACLASLAEHGIALEKCVQPLKDFRGIDRRFDVHADDGKSFVMDDYAHNPHKLSSMIEMASKIRPRITYIFQPHGFAPTRMMKKEYIEAFVKSLRPEDRVLFLPIYYVGGTVAKDISSDDLAAGVKAGGKNGAVGDREEILASVKAGEAYVVCGARDESLGEFAKAIAKKMKAGRAGVSRETSAQT